MSANFDKIVKTIKDVEPRLPYARVQELATGIETALISHGKKLKKSKELDAAVDAACDYFYGGGRVSANGMSQAYAWAAKSSAPKKGKAKVETEEEED